jgi:hypothetical protein
LSDNSKWADTALRAINARFEELPLPLRQAGWASLSVAYRHAVNYLLRAFLRDDNSTGTKAAAASAEEWADEGRPWNECRTQFGVWQAIARQKVRPLLHNWLSDGGLSARGILNTSDKAASPRPVIDIGADWWLPARDLRHSGAIKQKGRPYTFVDWERSEMARFVVDNADRPGVFTRVVPLDAKGGTWKAIAVVSNIQIKTAQLLERLPLEPGQLLEPTPDKIETRGRKKEHDDELYRLLALEYFFLHHPNEKKAAIHSYVAEKAQAMPGVRQPEETAISKAIAPATSDQKLADFMKNRPSELARKAAKKRAVKGTNARGK